MKFVFLALLQDTQTGRDAHRSTEKDTSRLGSFVNITTIVTCSTKTTILGPVS